MKSDLLKAAAETIPNQQILVNVISRRVRQLALGHRPLVEFAPGMGLADIALTEVISNKLTFESTFGQDAKEKSENVISFPGVGASKKAA